MEQPKVIYEVKFNHVMDEEYEPISIGEETDTPSWRNSSEFCRRLVENTVRIVIPEKIENRGFFIAQAKEIAEDNEIDTKITEYEDRIIAEFHMDGDSTNFGIKGFIEYADDVCFSCDGGKAVLGVIYYTHETYCSGKKVTPENWQYI